MKKFMKVLCFMFVMVLALAPLASFAIDVDIQSFVSSSSDVSGATGVIQNLTSKIFGIIQVIGYAVAVILIVYLGIEWMICTPAKRAELKGRMWNMAIGIVLLVGGVTILGAVTNFATGL